jgi:hypothetical protein
MKNITPIRSETLDLLAEARAALATAKTLPDIRRIIEQAGGVADLAKRYARYAEAQHLTAETVRQAEAVTNEATVVKVEAQAKAGDVLREMAETGERAQPKDGGPSNKPVLGDLGITRNESSRWQMVAAIPAQARRAYVRETLEDEGELSTNGLLRWAREQNVIRHGILLKNAVPAGLEYRRRLMECVRDAGSIRSFKPADAAKHADDMVAQRIVDCNNSWQEWTRQFLAHRKEGKRALR